VTAGGTWCGDRGFNGRLLAKLLDPAGWVEAIYPLFRHRAKAAGLRLPLEIGIDTGAGRLRLVVTRRSSRLIEDELAPHDLRCPEPMFHQLLIGNIDIDRLRASGQAEPSCDAAFDAVAALFPPALFWQSQFDMLRF